MFIDSSVIVAMLAGEPDASALAGKIGNAKARFTSGVAILEASVRLSVLLDADPVVVEASVQRLLEEAAVSVVPINGSISKRAVAVFAKFGKGGKHDAQLNMADCLAYACAQAYRVPLLSKGPALSEAEVEG